MMTTRTAERSEVSAHEIRVYNVLARGRWVTSAELAKQAEVARRTASAHALKLVRLGVAEQVEAYPAHRYRLAPMAGKRNQGYIDRIRRTAEALGIPVTDAAGE